LIFLSIDTFSFAINFHYFAIIHCSHYAWLAPLYWLLMLLSIFHISWFRWLALIFRFHCFSFSMAIFIDSSPADCQLPLPLASQLDRCHITWYDFRRQMPPADIFAILRHYFRCLSLSLPLSRLSWYISFQYWLHYFHFAAFFHFHFSYFDAMAFISFSCFRHFSHISWYTLRFFAMPFHWLSLIFSLLIITPFAHTLLPHASHWLYYRCIATIDITPFIAASSDIGHYYYWQFHYISQPLAIFRYYIDSIASFRHYSYYFRH